MQYSVPQFVDIQDKIIGPFDLKQFLIFVFAGLLCLGFWSIFDLGIIFFLLALPTLILAGALAFGKFNGRPIMSNLVDLAKFFTTPKVRVFERTEEPSLAVVKKSSEKPGATNSALEEINGTSRLRNLAYFLDQKAAEEERLVHSGQLKAKWLNQI